MFRLIKDCVPACHDLTELSERASTESHICIYRRTNSEGLAAPAVCLRIGPNRRLYSVTVTGRLKYPTHVSGLSLAFPCKPRSSLLIFTPGRARLELSCGNPIAAFLSEVKRSEMPLSFFRRVENLNERQLQSRQGCFPPQIGIPLRFIAARLSGLRSATLQLKTHVRPPRLFLSMQPFRPQTSAPRRAFASSRMAH